MPGAGLASFGDRALAAYKGPLQVGSRPFGRAFRASSARIGAGSRAESSVKGQKQKLGSFDASVVKRCGAPIGRICRQMQAYSIRGDLPARRELDCAT